MKYCTNCGHKNEDEAVFCEQCGQKLDEPVETKVINNQPESQSTEPLEIQSAATQTQQENKQPELQRTPPTNRGNSKKPWMIAVIVILVGIILGTILFFVLRQPNASQSETESSTQSSTQEMTKNSEQLEKYDAIIAEAKKLTIDGKYKESELKLAEIPVSALGKSEFSSIKEAIDDLTEKNNQGMKEQETRESQENKSSTSNSTFVGDFAKWASTYTFYYAQRGQIQRTLTIGANGSAKQNNDNGTQFFGQATITNATGDILSYNTDELYPTSMPGTKMIHPDVKITIKWDNGGGTQTLYGYLSYSSRLVLTDGAEKGSGVNEVWITY